MERFILVKLDDNKLDNQRLGPIVANMLREVPYSGMCVGADYNQAKLWIDLHKE